MAAKVTHVYGKRKTSEAETAFLRAASASSPKDSQKRPAEDTKASLSHESTAAIGAILHVDRLILAVVDDDQPTQELDSEIPSPSPLPSSKQDSQHEPKSQLATTIPVRVTKLTSSPAPTRPVAVTPQSTASSLRKIKSEDVMSSPKSKSVRFTYGSSPRRSHHLDEPDTPCAAREAFEAREAGRSLQIADDLHFLLDGLGPTKGPSLRAVSLFKLSKECNSPDARMYLRAHNLLPTIFTTLKDAHCNQTLGLNAACFLYLLAKDSLSPDSETTYVPILADLIRASSACNTQLAANAQYERMASQIKSLLSSRHSLETVTSISARHLALEACCVVLGQHNGNRASFRSELRVASILDDLIDSLQRHAQALSDAAVEPAALCDAELVLRVLQNAIFRDESNQNYLVHLRESALLTALSTLVTKLSARLAHLQHDGFRDSSSLLVADCLFGAVRVLLGLTHNNEHACVHMCSQLQFVQNLLSLCDGARFPTELRHDGLVLVLSLLVNLVEHSKENSAAIVRVSSGAIWGTLLQLYQLGADESEANTSVANSQEEDTSKSIVAVYCAVLICFLCKDQPEHQALVAAIAPGGHFANMAHHIAQFEAYRISADLPGVGDMEAVIKLLVSYEPPASCTS